MREVVRTAFLFGFARAHQRFLEPHHAAVWIQRRYRKWARWRRHLEKRLAKAEAERQKNMPPLLRQQEEMQKKIDKEKALEEEKTVVAALDFWRALDLIRTDPLHARRFFTALAAGDVVPVIHRRAWGEEQEMRAAQQGGQDIELQPWHQGAG